MGAEQKLKHIKLERQNDQVQTFIRSLPLQNGGCIIEVDGKPLLQISAITTVAVDKKKLKAAILSRRDKSRKLNQDWEAVDREVWERIPDNEE